MSFQLLDDRVAIIADPEPDEKTSDAGLILPETTNTFEPRYGTVAEVGLGHVSEFTHKYVTPSVEVGQRVMFHPHVGEKWKIEGTEYRILNVREIIGIEIGGE